MRIELALLGLGVVAYTWLRRQNEDRRDDQARSRGTYRPGSASGDGVRFNDAQRASTDAHAPRDAFTAEDLDPARTIYQCQDCRVWYHGDTVRSLAVENHGKCVACGSASIVRDRVTERRLTEDAD